MIDAIEGMTDQDKKIAATVMEAGKGLVVAVNKWDLVENKNSSTMSKFDKNLENVLPPI